MNSFLTFACYSLLLISAVMLLYYVMRDTFPFTSSIRPYKTWFLCVLCVLGFTLGSATVYSGKEYAGTEIELKAEKLPFTPKEFYIANVVDKRKDKSAVAWLVPATKGTVKAASNVQKLDLKGGTLEGVKQFFAKSLATDKKLRPITVHIQELRVIEETSARGGVDGKATINLSFYLNRDGQEVHLLDYKGGAQYGRSVVQQTVVEQVLRQSLGNALKYLNTWIDQEAPHNEKLATGIKVIFSEPSYITAEDTIYYSPKRLLTWSDFKAVPNGRSQYAASVFPGFGYKGSTKVVNGIVHLNLTLQVFMLQQSSWVKDVARNPYALNHEQKHFDIVRIVAENFKKRIKPEELTVEDYNSMIQYQYLEAFREMNKLQEQYDGETRHGIDKEAQARWNKRIEGELKKLGVN